MLNNYKNISNNILFAVDDLIQKYQIQKTLSKFIQQHNEWKSVTVEQFKRTVKNKIYKY